MDQVLLAQGALQLQRTAFSSSVMQHVRFSQKDDRSVLWVLRVLICFLDVWKHGPIIRVTRAPWTNIGVLFIAVHQ